MIDTTNIPQLGQLIEPTPVRFSFAAPGWYVVGAAVLLCIIIFTIYKFIVYTKNKYRRSSLKWLNEQEKTLSPNKQYATLIYNANMLMKRIAILRYGREQVAALRSDEWFDFLNKKCKTAPFDENSQGLIDQLYKSAEKVTQTDTNTFLRQVEIWIKTHRYDAR